MKNDSAQMVLIDLEGKQEKYFVRGHNRTEDVTICGATCVRNKLRKNTSNTDFKKTLQWHQPNNKCRMSKKEEITALESCLNTFL